jgi:excisionase family DNA binding protein
MTQATMTEPATAWLSTEGLCARLACSRTTLLRWVHKPGSTFPRPAQLGGRRHLYSWQEVEQWIRAQRDAQVVEAGKAEK